MYIGEICEDEELISGRKRILIYGTGRYGEKVYRNLIPYGRDKDVEAFIETNPQNKNFSHNNIPILNPREAAELYADSIVCVSGSHAEAMKQTMLDQGIQNIHQIRFNDKCERWGTEYGGFYIPSGFVDGTPFTVYSFGIGEDLSFSEEAVRRGGEVYAFDPTPKSIKYVENHALFLNPKFHFFTYGLSNRDGIENFYLPLNPEYVSASVLRNKNVDERNPICVRMKTLRTIMRELGHCKIDILKMDIEGAEFKVMHDIMDSSLEQVSFRLCCMETHERLLEDKDIVYGMYSEMSENGFYDLYGVAGEPTFVRLE